MVLVEMQVTRQVRAQQEIVYAPIVDIKSNILVGLLVTTENVQNVELR
jgi:hypothetical protein